MPISHVCQSCGFDLASTRPIHDPYYRLPVVVCPKCSVAAVRMRHPLQHLWKTVMRYDTIATAFAMHFALLAASIILAVVFCFVVPLTITAVILDEVSMRELAPAIVVGAVFPLALGAWLTAGFTHIPRWRAFLGWALAAVAAHTIVITFVTIAGIEGLPGTDWIDVDGRSQFGAVAVLVIGSWSAGVVIIAGITALATAGIPAGFALRSLARTFRTLRFRMRRRHLRRRRLG